MKKFVSKIYFTVIAYSAPLILFAQASGQSGNQSKGVEGIVSNVTGALGSVAALITSLSALAGLGFGIAATFKFKQHKDNPQQVPIGQPLTLLAIAVMLLWLPFLLQSLGVTVSGDATGAGAAKIGDTAPSWLKDGNNQ